MFEKESVDVMKIKRGLKYDFSLLALMLIPVGVSLSVVGYQLSVVLKLPVFVDQIGIYLVGMIAGPWVGMLTGLLGNVVNGMLNPTSVPFALVSMGVGFLAGCFSRWKWYKNIVGFILAAIINVAYSTVAATIVQIFVFGGVTGTGVDLITAAIVGIGNSLLQSVVGVNLISGIACVIINWGISMIIIRKLPDRFLVKLNYGMPYLKGGAKNA